MLREQRNRSLIDVQRELQRIALCKTLAPITGLVAIKQNRAGNFNFGQQMPDIREGDTLQPGMPVADILDLSEVEVWAKVGELDRANLKEGQEATLQLDAIPDKRFGGKIKAMSGTATSDVFSGDPSKKFDVIFSVDMRQLLDRRGHEARRYRAHHGHGGSQCQEGNQRRGQSRSRRLRRRVRRTIPAGADGAAAAVDGAADGRAAAGGRRRARSGRCGCAGSRRTRRLRQYVRRRPQEDERFAPEDAGGLSAKNAKSSRSR